MSNRFLTALVLLLPAPLWAGDLGTPAMEPAVAAPMAAHEPDLIFTLRGGIASTPEYFGSDDYVVGPDFAFRLNFLRLPGGRTVGSSDPRDPRYGLGLRGSFRYIDERSGDDSPELDGLDDVDTSVELGLGLGYSSRNFDAFADLRYGVIGHESFVGELGADVKVQPTDRLTLSLGPRLLIGSDDYVDTYFGVGAAEAAASDFTAYQPDGGLVSAGLELGMRYQISDQWGVEGAVTWERFTGDAKDSPIVEQGDRDQYGIRLGVTRRITLDF